MSGEIERCIKCDQPTGRCGEDSIFFDDRGPLCEECFDKLQGSLNEQFGIETMTDTPAAAGTLVEMLRDDAAYNREVALLSERPVAAWQADLLDSAQVADLAADELSACRAELARMAKTAADNFESAESAIAAKEQSERLLAAAERDAARYRWLRKNRPVLLLTGFFGNGCINKLEEDADDYIDAALASKDSPK